MYLARALGWVIFLRRVGGHCRVVRPVWGGECAVRGRCVDDDALRLLSGGGLSARHGSQWCTDFDDGFSLLRDLMVIFAVEWLKRLAKDFWLTSARNAPCNGDPCGCTPLRY